MSWKKIVRELDQTPTPRTKVRRATENIGTVVEEK